MKKSGYIAIAAALGVGMAIPFVSGAALADGHEGAHSGDASIVVENFIGRLTVTEGSRLSYDIDNGEGVVEDVDIEEKGGVLYVDGNNKDHPKNCRYNNDRMRLQMKGDKMRPLSDFPTLKITVPEGQDFNVEMMGGIADLPNGGAFELQLNGCGDINLGNASGPVSAALRGSGDINGGDAAELALKLYGSGDIHFGESAGSAAIILKGSGDVTAKEVNDSLLIELAGSGDVEVDNGKVDDVKIELRGSGDVVFGGEAGDVSVSVKGSGDVYVKKASGSRDVSVRGSGDVKIDQWTYDRN